MIDYRLKIHGVPVRWRSRIEAWEENLRFVDVQVKGPYSKWHHTHEFTPLNGGTLMTDTVLYRVPMGPPGRFALAHWIERDLFEIFQFRKKVIEEIFT